MSIEVLELTMSHVGLGNLNEQGLMILFGNAHSHALVKDLKLTPSQIADQVGNPLYPAYFMTRLTVPRNALLPSIKLWETVCVGVDVRRFGSTLLESKYALGRGSQLPEDPTQWHGDRYPIMEGNNLLVIDTGEDTNTKRRPSSPKSGYLAELPKTSQVPKGIALSKQARTSGFMDIQFPGYQFCSSDSLHYKILPGRDVSAGHALIFAKFVEMMDIAEHRFLSERFEPAFSTDLLHCLSIVDREIYYFGNCYAGEVLKIDLRGSIEMPDDQGSQNTSDYIPAAFLNIIFEIRQRRNNVLLVLAKARKICAVPMQNQDLIFDVSRILAQTNARN